MESESQEIVVDQHKEAAETLKVVDLIDVCTDDGVRLFSQDIVKSNGSCLVLVHPFHNSAYIEGMDTKTPELEKISRELNAYHVEMRELVLKAQSHKIPIMVFVGATGTSGNLTTRKDDLIQNAQASLKQNLQSFLGFSEGILYIVPTMGSTPIPLIEEATASKYARLDRPLRYRRMWQDFTEKMRTAGLKKIVVAGSNFGGGPVGGLFSSIYDPIITPLEEGAFHKQEGFEWTLADYYAAKRKGNQPHHPFEKVHPKGCVADVLRGFAFSGINVGLSKVTYPQKIQGMEFVDHTAYYSAVPRRPTS